MSARARPVEPLPQLIRIAVVFGVAMAMALMQVGAADAQDLPFNRGVTDACVPQAMEADRFADVHLGQMHSESIDCLWVYGVVQGRFVDGENIYRPHDDVSRQQMASFIVRMLLQLPDRYYTVPAPDDGARFEDSHDISDAHVRSVNALHDAGIVEGHADGTYRPREDVDRAQIASFIAHSIEDVLQDELPRAAGIFDDVAGNAHEENIEKLATAGIVQGRNGSYHPNDSTTRAQMASIVARAMDYLVNTGVLIAMEFGAGTATSHVLTDIEWGRHDVFERVTFTLEGDEGTASWRMGYVDAAIQDGSGLELDVEGDAIIEVTLTGAGPPDTDIDFDAHFGGDAVVEVVDGGWYEGHHQLFVGTTGLHDFSASQLGDPRRVYMDVFPD